MGATLTLALGLIFGTMPPASADTVHRPGSDFNGNVLYISRACHDGNDGTPGGACITNRGCFGSGNFRLSENVMSKRISRSATFAGRYDTLLDRGYRVVIGNGTVSQNTARSNSRPNVKLHIPIHTNATSGENCNPRAKSRHGTEGLYRYSPESGAAIASRIKSGK